MEVQWENPAINVATAGNEVYPPVLDAIKDAVLNKEATFDDWGILAEFDNTGTARDLASRLGKKYRQFEIVSRKRGDQTLVYARLRENWREYDNG